MEKARRNKRIMLTVIVLGFIAALLGALSTEEAGARLCTVLRQQLSQKLGLEVAIRSCRIKPLSFRIHLEDIAIPPLAPRFAAQSLDMSLRGIFPGHLSLRDVALHKPRLEMDFGLKQNQTPLSPRTCPLDALKRIRVGALTVTQGFMRMRLPGGQTLHAHDIALRAAIGRNVAAFNVEAPRGSVDVEGQHVPLGRLGLQARLHPQRRALELRRGTVHAAGAEARLHGHIESLCATAPTLALTGRLGLPAHALPRLGLPVALDAGQIVGQLSLTGPASAPVAHATVQATQLRLGRFHMGDFSLKATYARDVVTIERLWTQAGEGQLDISGEMQLREGLPIRLQLNSNKASFARILARTGLPHAWVEFPASVRGTVTGTLLPAPALSGDVHFSTGPFALTSHAWDDARPHHAILPFQKASGVFVLHVSKEAVAFRDVQLQVGDNTHLRGQTTIFFDRARGIEVDATAAQLDLSDFGSIVELPWSGVGTAAAHLLYNHAGTRIHGRAAIKNFTLAGYSLGVVQAPIRYANRTLSIGAVAAQKGHTHYAGNVDFVFTDGGPHMRGRLQLADGQLEDVAHLLPGVTPQKRRKRPTENALTGRLSAVAAVAGPLSKLTCTVNAHIRNATYLRRPLGTADVTAHLDGSRTLTLLPATFTGPLGRIHVSGRGDVFGPLDFSVEVEAGDMAALIHPIGTETPHATGNFTATLRVSGRTDAPHVDAALHGDGLRWRNKPVGAGRLQAKLRGTEVEVTGTLAEDVHGHLQFTMRDNWPYTAQLQGAVRDIAPFFSVLPETLHLALEGQVTATGALQALSKSTVRAEFTHLKFSRRFFQTTNVGPVRLGWARKTVDIDFMHLKGPTSDLSVQGKWGPQAVRLKSHGTVDVSLLSSFAQPIRHAQGNVRFSAAVTGTAKKPKLTGNASFSDVGLTAQNHNIRARHLTGRVRFSEAQVLLEEIHGLVNEGTINVYGNMQLDGLAIASLNLNTALKDVALYVTPEVPVALSGTLWLAKQHGRSLYQLSGALDVNRFRHAERLSWEDVLSAKAGSTVPSRAEEAWLALDVGIHAADGVQLDNNLARAHLSANLRLLGTNARPRLVGPVEFQKGAQVFFRNNTYRINHGLLQFNGLRPTVDVSAQTTVRDYRIVVTAFGRLDAPKLSFTSEPYLARADVISLLTVGVTSREGFNDEAATGLAAEALLSVSGVGAQVQQFLRDNVGLKGHRLHFTSSFNETTGSSEPAVAWEAKVLNEKLKVGITQPVTGRGTRAKAEYRIERDVSARFQWDNQNQNTSVGNPGMDVRFLFEWE